MRSRCAGRTRILTAALGLLLAFAEPVAAAPLQLVNEFGGRGSATGQFQGGGGGGEDLQVAPSGNLVVSDTGNFRIQVFTPAGGFVRAFGSAGTGPGQFMFPVGIAIRANGTIFVVDQRNYRVEVFNAAGVYQREFALPQQPFYTGAALDRAEASLYIADRDTGIIRRVATTGAAMGQFGSSGTGNGQFGSAFGLAVDDLGSLYVAEQGNHRVQKLSPNGSFLAKFGGFGRAPGQMSAPLDVAVEPDGNILVADSNNRRLQEFSPSGRFLASYDRIAGSPNPTFRPWAVTVAPSGDIYVYDVGRARILRVRKQPGPPVLGQSVNAAPLQGRVLVREKGTGRFHVLTARDSIPVGSLLDTRRGEVGLTTARDRQGHTQTGQFAGGIFQVRQSRSAGGLTELRLRGGDFDRCSRRARGATAAGAGKRVIRKIDARARRGRFRTRGRYSASTVRGTVWDTIDRCDGTLTRVRKGTVVVRDLPRGRTVILHAGQRYLASR